ncbi:type I restriction modification DNA specificity domain protein [Lachnoanaerobaculum sp. MSX33]|uniref:restriction endonuclease subunit S n=1 Tax=Lachnoanaerobaculum sp. MSX33 TaxID=936596 RepID=UPI0003DF858F|nr:restriction endonuclease subunit S [Lachnoanaerobaculum sp. MSX33]ETO97422.1 type I restriction modification DNA specificity domain protein [Lachnoanaerobaculum sp. MSX33]
MAKYKLGDICEIVSGSTPKTEIEEYWNGDIKWITPAELDDESYIVYDTTRKITELAVKKTGLSSFPEGTVILSSRAPIGKVAIAGCEMYCNQGFKNLICSEKIYNRYLFWFLKGNTEYLNSFGRGATFKEISKKIVSDIEINVPEMNLQKKAVLNLERLSKIISLRKSEIDKLDALIRARFFELFGDLVEGDKIKENRRKIGDIASVTKLAGFEFTKYIKYKDIGSIGDVIMLRGLNCKRGKIILDDIKWIERETSDLLPRSKLYIGDILITYAGTIGDVALVDEDNKYHLAPNVGKITIIDKLSYDPVFLVHLLMYSNKYIMSFVSKVAQASINMQKIRNFEYYFPGFEKQKYFSTFVEQVNKSKVEVQKALDKAQLLFDSLMQKYFG